MASFFRRIWFQAGLVLSVIGIIWAFVGLYWDPLNGRKLVAGGIGLLQTMTIIGGVALCIVGMILLLAPFKKPAATVPLKRRIKPAGKNQNGKSRKKKSPAPARKRTRNALKR